MEPQHLCSPGAGADRVTAREVTDGFTAAASGLNTGQLVKDDYFTLYEAVGALEIMDPKMDSGYLAGGNTLDDDYDILRILMPEEVLSIMDEMLCFEMAWHMGHPLSQSLFTSVYIDRMLCPEPKTLEQACFEKNKTPEGNHMLHLVLRAFCLGLIKTCDFVHQSVTKEHFYEEEDFVANLYHWKLLPDFEVTQINQLLDDAIMHLTTEDRISEKALTSALIVRLQFRRQLLAAVRTDEPMDATRAPIWGHCLDLLDMITSSNQLGIPVEGSFSMKIQHKLASTVPPRPIVKIPFNDAFDCLTKLCQYSKEAYQVLDCQSGPQLLTFIWAFQSRTPQPPVYVRSLLQSLTISEMNILGAMSLKQCLFGDLEEIVLPANIIVDPRNEDVEAPQDARFQITKIMDKFVTKVAAPYLDILRTVCMNRSRLRRMLCHLVIDWDNVQLEAGTYDADLRRYTKEEPINDPENPNEGTWAFPLSSWAYYQKLRQMEWIVQMGFELDIYQMDELGGMYWYLQHLASTRIQHLERIRTFVSRSLKYIANPSAQQMAVLRRSISFLDFSTLEASATQSFADGLSCFYSFLSHIGLMPPSYGSMPYSSPAMRYSLRMRPFLPISLPEVPSFPQFISLVSLRRPEKGDSSNAIQNGVNNMDLKDQAYSILEVADQALKIARKEWEAISKANPETARCLACEDWWRSSVKNVLRSCITANIMVATAKKALAKTGSTSTQHVLCMEIPPGSGKGYHPWWVIPRITAR